MSTQPSGFLTVTVKGMPVRRFATPVQQSSPTVNATRVSVSARSLTFPAQPTAQRGMAKALSIPAAPREDYAQLPQKTRQFGRSNIAPGSDGN